MISRYLALFLALYNFFPVAVSMAHPVTVLAPSRPFMENIPADLAQNPKKKLLSAPENEVDVLMTVMRPAAYAGEDMDQPQLFAAIFYPENYVSGKMQPELLNLLGDVEEIRYLNKKAWGANVSVNRPGLYQFILEGKPWWDDKRKLYLHQQAKVVLPVGRNNNRGWAESFGQSFEILPLTRPFGLMVPALFSARLLLDGKPLQNILVRFGRINSDRAKIPSQWHDAQECLSDANGQFAILLTEPGWWYCEASIDGAPLKGPDGEMSPVERSTVLWLFVNARPDSKNRK